MDATRARHKRMTKLFMGQHQDASAGKDIWATAAECKGWRMKQAAARCVLPHSD